MLPQPVDVRGRMLRDLRISVTDRCNFRCTYCMPRAVFGPGYQFLPLSSIMTFEEIVRLAGLFASLGVEKVRLTGGEPLLRAGLDQLVANLAAVPGIHDLAMTTNGSRLTLKQAQKLRQAGLSRITISLDAVDDAVFGRVNDVQFPVARVLDAVSNAEQAGFTTVKINMVVQRHTNADQIMKMAEHFRHSGHILRFIEFMDVGNSNHWAMDEVIPSREIFALLNDRWPLVATAPSRPGEVATRFQYADGGGEIGLISSVTEPFCQGCTRARLSAEGRLYLCLFAENGLDVLTPLRNGASAETLTDLIRSAWITRDDQYSVERSDPKPARQKVEMSRIGG